MAKIIHFADLHIKRDEKEYCYAVLDEIIARAAAEKAAFLLVSGDLFDSFADFEALRREVTAKFALLAEAGCRVIYIPGNHEARGAAAELSAFSLEHVAWCARAPFELIEAEGVEFLCVPHAADYDGYRDWQVPPKREGAVRVALVHALNSTIYNGPDEESDSKTGVIEDDFFRRFAVDYAAMGHVHSGRQQVLGGAVVCYPGSARVWRAHRREAGPKTLVVADLGNLPVAARPVEIKAAGRYREYSLPVDTAGAPPLLAVQKIERELAPEDFVRVRLTGVVEDENAAKAAADTLRQRLGNRARWADTVLETTAAANISSNALVKAFLAEMDAREPEDRDGQDYARWLLARQYGLEELAERAGEGS